MLRTFILAGLGLVLTVSLASGQALGDIARKEQARRQEVKKPAKVYTNDDLRSDAGSQPPAPPVSSAASQPPAAAAAPPSPAPDPAADAKKTEAYWKDRMTKARENLDRSRTLADALQSRINALTADFAAKDDPIQRAQIGNDRQKALDELDRLKKEIEKNTKAITDIQEEARKAGVPAGWVR